MVTKVLVSSSSASSNRKLAGPPELKWGRRRHVLAALLAVLLVGHHVRQSQATFVFLLTAGCVAGIDLALREAGDLLEDLAGELADIRALCGRIHRLTPESQLLERLRELLEFIREGNLRERIVELRELIQQVAGLIT